MKCGARTVLLDLLDPPCNNRSNTTPYSTITCIPLLARCKNIDNITTDIEAPRLLLLQPRMLLSASGCSPRRAVLWVTVRCGCAQAPRPWPSQAATTDGPRIATTDGSPPGRPTDSNHGCIATDDIPPQPRMHSHDIAPPLLQLRSRTYSCNHGCLSASAADGERSSGSKASNWAHRSRAIGKSGQGAQSKSIFAFFSLE